MEPTNYRSTFRIPTLFTRLEEMNVATRPITEHNPLKAPTMDGLIPVKYWLLISGHFSGVVNLSWGSETYHDASIMQSLWRQEQVLH
jgi:hypothetical protein